MICNKIIPGEHLMKIGAYQFAVSNNITKNLEAIKKAIILAVQKGIELLIFPECALTGYPPRDIPNSSMVNFDELAHAYKELQKLVDDNDISIIVGTIYQENENFYNSAIGFIPHNKNLIYHKRALWGWDKDNFIVGNEKGILEIGDWKIGIRICFEVRFPEYFRELYKEHTDLNIILFYDVADNDDIDRYDLIKSHIRTRAVENVTYTFTVNSIHPYQTAPTLLYDRSGRLLCENERNTESLLMYDLKKESLNFGEAGRKEISDRLTSSTITQ